MTKLDPSKINKLLEQSESILTRLDALLPAPPAALDWQHTLACRWKHFSGLPVSRNGAGYLSAVSRLSNICLDDLLKIDLQKQILFDNTQQFVSRLPANNVLLTGSRGSGKSSLVKALLNSFSKQGLRLIEVDKQDLVFLPEIVGCIEERPERFIIFCDDLSFEQGDASYKALKVTLDGGIFNAPDNVLIYATSNRRHLMPESFSENTEYTRGESGEIYPGESIEEKNSLAERFGLWVSFYPFSQSDYLEIVEHWLGHFQCQLSKKAQQNALTWATQRGSRSGRVAWQFAKDWVGKTSQTPKKTV